MKNNGKTSFKSLKSIKFAAEFEIANCEKICLSDIDGDGKTEIIIARWGFSKDKYAGEIAIYDMELNLKAIDKWEGMALDVAVSSTQKIIVSGSIGNNKPVIRAYNYNESNQDKLELLSQTSWDAPEKAYGVAKAVHINKNNEITVLTIVEGNNGYAQLWLYDENMGLKGVRKWTPMYAGIVKWGHCMVAADLDGDGNDELITLVNYRHENRQKADLRVFDNQLNLMKICESMSSESIFATCMSAGDIDNDGEIEIVLSGGAFTDIWKGATNRLMVLNSHLIPKSSTTWKTFRHSWVWDVQIGDFDRDGNTEIITYGGTSMRGKNQDEANIMGEICVWDSDKLVSKDMFIWQSEPGKDTRPSRGVAFIDENKAKLVLATSKFSDRQQTRDLEIRVLEYEPVSGVIRRYSDIINAYNERDVEALAELITYPDFSPIVLEALSFCDPKDSTDIISRLLDTVDQKLFFRTVEILREMGDEGNQELYEIGFALPENWAIISPFDNTDNRGFDFPYPPELELDLNGFYAGKDKIVHWGRIDDHPKNVYIDLSYTHFESFERTGIEFGWNVRRTEAVAYLLTYVDSPEDIEAQFRIGSSDTIKIWLNDELKFSLDTLRNAYPDQDIFSVRLKKGDNKVLIKVGNYKTNGWGFYFRITDAQGRILRDLKYKTPEVRYIHNQMLPVNEILTLLESQDEYLQCLAAGQLIISSDKRGNETLFRLLKSENSRIRAKAAMMMTLAGDKRGLDTLAHEATSQDHLFQIAAGNILKRSGDSRCERFSIDNLKDETGKNIVEIKVAHRDNGFRVSPLFKGEETAHSDIGTNRRFHLGDDVSVGYAIILSFGIREPKYRGMGLGEVAIKRSDEITEEMGYACSLVCTGVNLVAHRLYCQRCYVDRRFPWVYGKHLNRREIRDIDANIIVRDYKNDDKADVERLINQYNLNSVGPADWKPRANFGTWTKIAEHEGKLIGYADVHIDPFESVAHINMLHVDMDFDDKETAVQALLLAIQDYALEESKDLVSFSDPPVKYREIILRMGYEVEPINLRHRWVGMLKVINLAKFLKEISPLLSIRLRRSLHLGWRGSLCLKGSRLGATLIIDKDGNVNVDDSIENADIIISTDDKTITSLVSCNGDMWESYKHNELSVKPIYSERIRNLIETLFPMLPTKQGGWW